MDTLTSAKRGVKTHSRRECHCLLISIGGQATGQLKKGGGAAAGSNPLYAGHLGKAPISETFEKASQTSQPAVMHFLKT